MSACSRERLADLSASHRAAAERDHARAAPRAALGDGVLLELAELGLAPLREELRDRRASSPLDLAVEVDERPPEALGDLARRASTCRRP